MKKTSALPLIIAILLIAGGIIALVRSGDNQVKIIQAQAVIESARAAQGAAEAARVASRGLSTVSAIQALILAAIVFAVLAIIGAILYLLIEKRRQDAKLLMLMDAQMRPRWAPGPNARFRKAGEQPALASGDAVSQLVQVMLLKQLGLLQAPQLPQPPAQNDPDESDDLSMLW